MYLVVASLVVGARCLSNFFLAVMRKNFPYLGHFDQCVAVFGQGSVRHPATFFGAFAILGHDFHVTFPSPALSRGPVRRWLLLPQTHALAWCIALRNQAPL